MSKEAFQQQFDEAKRLYLEKRYEEALSSLTEIDGKYPDVFNIQFPMLQCLQHLGRIDEATQLHSRLSEKFTDEKHQAKLLKIARKLGAAENSKDESGTEKMEKCEGDESDSSQTPPETQQEQPPAKGASAFARLPRPLRALLLSAEIIIILGVVCAGILFLISKLDEAPEFYADMVIEFDDARFDGRVYFKSPKYNRTEIMEEMFIAKDGHVLRLLPEEAEYYKVSTADMMRHNPLVGASNINEWVRQKEAVKIGRETVEGYVCDVYEARQSEDPDAPVLTTKLWYALKLKFPIKSEMAIVGQKGKLTVSVKNIETGPLPETLFNVPTTYAEITGKRAKRKTPEEMSHLPSNDPLLEALNRQILQDNINSKE
ncbi:MAG TPA: hypothetical protein ENN29_13530 [Candidatus Hydrogenedentes bacterium]|nr:hypothetical protein [Candidatus Hydrogenedentota bacterium]